MRKRAIGAGWRVMGRRGEMEKMREMESPGSGMGGMMGWSRWWPLGSEPWGEICVRVRDWDQGLL